MGCGERHRCIFGGHLDVKALTILRLLSNKQLFAAVECPEGRQTFGLQWALLVDTLSVFASLGTADLELRYPGPNMELIFECVSLHIARSCCQTNTAST